MRNLNISKLRYKNQDKIHLSLYLTPIPWTSLKGWSWPLVPVHTHTLHLWMLHSSQSFFISNILLSCYPILLMYTFFVSFVPSHYLQGIKLFVGAVWNCFCSTCFLSLDLHIRSSRNSLIALTTMFWHQSYLAYTLSLLAGSWISELFPGPYVSCVQQFWNYYAVNAMM